MAEVYATREGIEQEISLLLNDPERYVGRACNRAYQLHLHRLVLEGLTASAAIDALRAENAALKARERAAREQGWREALWHVGGLDEYAVDMAVAELEANANEATDE